MHGSLDLCASGVRQLSTLACTWGATGVTSAWVLHGMYPGRAKVIEKRDEFQLPFFREFWACKLTDSNQPIFYTKDTEDVWDDTALVEAYDRAVNSFKVRCNLNQLEYTNSY